MIAMAKDNDHDDLYWGIVDSIVNDKRVSTHPHLRRVNSDHGFKLKKGEHDLVAECFLLEDLKDAISGAPKEAVLYHLEGRNDFATWVREIIGDKELSSDLEMIRPSREIDVQAKIIHVLDSRIKALKTDSVNLVFD
jgi:hypothetical protein